VPSPCKLYSIKSHIPLLHICRASYYFAYQGTEQCVVTFPPENQPKFPKNKVLIDEFHDCLEAGDCGMNCDSVYSESVTARKCLKIYHKKNKRGAQSPAI